MSQPRWETDPRVEVLLAARKQEPVLANLLELYAHDFSELRDLDVVKMADSAMKLFRFIGRSRKDFHF
jgi:hypothetical protein